MELYGKVVYAIHWLLLNKLRTDERYRMMFCTAGLKYHIVHRDSALGRYDVVRFEKDVNPSLFPRAKVAIKKIKEVYRLANINVCVVMDDDKKTNAYEDKDWDGLPDVKAYAEESMSSCL